MFNVKNIDEMHNKKINCKFYLVISEIEYILAPYL